MPGQVMMADPQCWHPPLTRGTNGTAGAAQPLPGSPAGNGCICGRGHILKCKRPIQMMLRCMYVEVGWKGRWDGRHRQESNLL